jgi:hypothetical protein
MYVLRKSFGPYSAGTHVLTELGLDVDTESDKLVIVDIVHDNSELEVSSNLLVKRRSMTRYAPAINSRQRRRNERAARRALGI